MSARAMLGIIHDLASSATQSQGRPAALSKVDEGGGDLQEVSNHTRSTSEAKAGGERLSLSDAGSGVIM